MYSSLKQAMKEAGISVSAGDKFTHADNVLARDFLYFKGKKLEDFIGLPKQVEESQALVEEEQDAEIEQSEQIEESQALVEEEHGTEVDQEPTEETQGEDDAA